VSQTAKEFFESLPERANGRTIEGVNSTYVFAIDGAGTWTVKVDDGKLVVDEGDQGGDCTISASEETDDGKLVVDEGDQGGDCTISASEETFQRIRDGKLNPFTAYMTGKLKVKGDMAAAMKLKELLG
jgi:hypothetical protein